MQIKSRRQKVLKSWKSKECVSKKHLAELKFNTECVDWVRKQALIARRYQLFIVKIDDVTSPNLMWRHCQFVVNTKSLLKHDCYKYVTLRNGRFCYKIEFLSNYLHRPPITLRAQQYSKMSFPVEVAPPLHIAKLGQPSTLHSIVLF